MSVDSVFQALGDPTRRALLERLGDGPLSVSELAAPLAVSLAERTNTCRFWSRVT